MFQKRRVTEDTQRTALLDLLPTILLLINIYNLLPFKPLFATGIHAWAPCTFWRSCSQIPIHSWHTMSWCGSGPERVKSPRGCGDLARVEYSRCRDAHAWVLATFWKRARARHRAAVCASAVRSAFCEFVDFDVAIANAIQIWAMAAG